MKYGVYLVAEWSDRSNHNPFFAALAMLPPDHVKKKLVKTFGSKREAEERAKEMNRSADRKGYDYFAVYKI